MATRSMKRGITRAVVATCAAALCITLIPAESHADPRPTVAEVTKRVDALHDQAEAAAEDYNLAQSDVADAQGRLTSVKARIKREQAALSKVQSQIGVFAAEAYRSGGMDSSLQLLMSDDPTQFLERSSSLDQVSRSRGTVLRQAQLAQQRLTQDKAELAQELDNVEKIKDKASSAKKTIDSKVAEAEKLLGSLKAEERAKYEAAQAARAAAAARASRANLRAADLSNDGSDSGSSNSGGSGKKKKSESSPSYDGPASGRAAAAVAYAKRQVGDRYVYAADGPNAFDCSGLTMMAWRAAGVSLPHQSGAQYHAIKHVKRSNLRPGDLVFFYSPISHVGIYIGGGMMVHAANPGDGVLVESINGYWAGVYSGAGRP